MSPCPGTLSIITPPVPRGGLTASHPPVRSPRLAPLCGILTAILLLAPCAVLAVIGEEHLHYAVSLWGIPAGHATMSVENAPSDDDHPLRRLITTATTNDAVSFFFRVRNRVDSLIETRTMLPRRLLFQRREGRRHEDFDIRFDHVDHLVTSFKDGYPTVLDIVPGTHDILSCLYFLRTLPALDPGTSIPLHIYHNGKNYEVQVNVEAVEQVTGPWGSVEAIRVLAIMPFRGIFLNEGNIRFWLTNTEERVPVMMEARVIVGSAKAVLVEGWTP